MTARRLLELLTRQPRRTLILWVLALALIVALNVDFRPVLDVRGLSPDGLAVESERVRTLSRTFQKAMHEAVRAGILSIVRGAR